MVQSSPTSVQIGSLTCAVTYTQSSSAIMGASLSQKLYSGAVRAEEHQYFLHSSRLNTRTVFLTAVCIQHDRIRYAPLSRMIADLASYCNKHMIGFCAKTSRMHATIQDTRSRAGFAVSFAATLHTTLCLQYEHFWFCHTQKTALLPAHASTCTVCMTI